MQNCGEAECVPVEFSSSCILLHVLFSCLQERHQQSLPVLCADLETEAVLNIDDDITVSCDSLLSTFQVHTSNPCLYLCSMLRTNCAQPQ